MNNTLRSFLILLLVATGFGIAGAQTFAPKDAQNVRKRHLMQQWTYENHQGSFPAPRKNNWSLGLNGGYAFVAGDVRSQPGWGAGLNLRKACGHIFSVRLSADYASVRGQNWLRSGGLMYNSALNGTNNPLANYASSASPFVYHNFWSQQINAGLDAVITLNNISFNRRTPKTLLYMFAGPSAFMYKTSVNALDASGKMYDYSGINPGDVTTADARSTAYDRLNNLMDDSYETKAETYGNKAAIGNFTLIPALNIGAGMQFRLGRRVDLSIEHRIIATFDDLVDGQRWQPNNSQTASADYRQMTSVGLNFRIGKGEDAAWWSNPMEGPLGRIRSLEAASAKDVKDSDSDGVVDAQDREPNTPAGVKVDIRGAAIDSDEDGLPDFKDSEPFSPKGSQVDRSGRALDSDFDGVPDVFDKEINSRSGAQVDAHGVEIKLPEQTAVASSQLPADLNLMMPIIHFDLGSAVVRSEFYPGLYQVARILKSDPSLKLKLTGHADNRNTTQYNKGLSEQRADNVMDFMIKNFGITKERFVVEYFGADKPVVSGLPANKDPRFEELHHLNRRVELEIVR